MGLFDKIRSKMLSGDGKTVPASATFATRPDVVYAPVSGMLVSLKEVKDEVLPVALLGDGYGILPTTNTGVVYAPVDGVIGATTMTNHSIVIAAEGGMEVLIHIGIGTVNMGGKGFSRFVETGEAVRAGQPIMTFNDDSIKQAGYEDVVCCTISNPDAFSQIDHVGDTSTLLDGRPLVKIGDPLLVARRA